MASRCLTVNILVALLVCDLGCTASSAPSQDQHTVDTTGAVADISRDAAVDTAADIAASFDVNAPLDLVADKGPVQCVSLSCYAALCDDPNGNTCCASGAAWYYWCPAGYTCSNLVVDCLSDAGPKACPSTSSCLSPTGCWCVPSTGQCEPLYQCVPSCASMIPACPDV